MADVKVEKAELDVVRILIVENDPAVYRMLGSTLARRHPITTVNATNHREARDHFKAFTPHVIVMDGRILDGETPALVKEFREQGFTGPIVANSSSYDVQDELIKAGCDHASPSKMSHLILPGIITALLTKK